jgi:glycosyltransferase involved in cell wall biosynthesis
VSTVTTVKMTSLTNEARKPVIATVAEGVRDAIPGREFGVVVATNDQIALAGEIERLSQNANLRTEMAQRAYERACLLFGLKAHSRDLTRLYDQLIDGASIATNPGTWQPSE